MNDAIRTIYDLIDLCNLNNIDGILMMVDFEKAFDVLEFDFIIKTLEHRNFSPSLIRWITLFYNRIESCVFNNRMASLTLELDEV